MNFSGTDGFNFFLLCCVVFLVLCCVVLCCVVFLVLCCLSCLVLCCLSCLVLWCIVLCGDVSCCVVLCRFVLCGITFWFGLLYRMIWSLDAIAVAVAVAPKDIKSCTRFSNGSIHFIYYLSEKISLLWHLIQHWISIILLSVALDRVTLKY